MVVGLSLHTEITDSSFVWSTIHMNISNVMCGLEPNRKLHLTKEKYGQITPKQ